MIDGQKEWYCRFCPETDVWTRWRCRRCFSSTPSVLQGKHRQAVPAKAGRCSSGSSGAIWLKVHATLLFSLCFFLTVLFPLRLRPGLNGRAVGNPFGKPTLRNGSRKYIPPPLRSPSLTINYRTANVTVKTPIRGSDVPTNFRSEKCSLV